MSPTENEPQVGALLRIAWEALQAELYHELRAAGFDDLREVHRPMLRYPPIDGMRPTDLAARVKLSKQATNDLIRELEGMGYIRLERDQDDGRARIIRYTERGWRMYRAGSDISRAIGQRWAAKIGKRQYEQFHATLRAIVDLTAQP
ncbi:winged helix-turn-helix transcriptional regulator [Dactylosporangium aurantiacum]|uniref:Winged helix-turn-helix transcriptional regulator n=1 Tax=Dactylosporangium aurantiacum TaxID=35754 RepID=A0A9Q9MRP9_9ACTN|nr:MarR family winged helix-turn-helix transcriptional regulator [Dactylosporangium aurantiacum]MDG6107687.1 MarR family winged helix-turn-helix transcriptional regulator [Dactylosporangium aurantiacum]UWZ58722.1 winged helix-turn-helix transcriptional regulator [Dactylosporangium aurantiacum]